MAGTGAASVDDCVRLTRRAFDCGYAAALIMPPFFFRDASDGRYRRLLRRAVRADERCRETAYCFTIFRA